MLDCKDALTTTGDTHILRSIYVHSTRHIARYILGTYSCLVLRLREPIIITVQSDLPKTKLSHGGTINCTTTRRPFTFTCCCYISVYFHLHALLLPPRFSSTATFSSTAKDHLLVWVDIQHPSSNTPNIHCQIRVVVGIGPYNPTPKTAV